MLYKHKNNKGKKVGTIAHLFFIPLFLLAGFSSGYGSPSLIDQNVVIAYQNVLKLKLEEGKKRMVKVAPSNENLPIKLYTENLADILELLLTEDRILYNQKRDHEKKRLTKLQALQNSNPYKLFCEAEIRLQWAFVKLKFGDELSAVWNLSQAYKTIALNAANHPEFMPNKKTLGLLNILFGAVPQQYHWLLSLLSLEGSTTEGMRQLEALAQSNHFFSFESRILINLMNIYLMGKPIVAVGGFQKLIHHAPENKLLQYLYALILMKSSKAEMALEALTHAEMLNTAYLPIASIDYLKGEIYLQKGLYDKASHCYASFLSHYKGENFVKDAYYKLFLVHWLEGDEKLAKSYSLQARHHGTTVSEADKYAAKQLSLGTYPEKTILKIRLATDGGYYEKAQMLLDQYTVADFSSFQDKVEFIYRKARLYHKQNKKEKAIKYYRETIEQSGNQLWYFAPNAALQLGYIYMERENVTAARKYFQKALTYKDHEYKNSIDNKAKIALEKIR